MNLAWRTVGVWFVLTQAAAPALAERSLDEVRGEVSVRAEIDADKVALSGHVVLALLVEGPAPVDLIAPNAPEELLTKESSQSWLVELKGSPQMEMLANNRQRWRQEYRLSPYALPGPHVEIALAPVRLRAGNAKEMLIHWSRSLDVEVTTSAVADVKSLRPVTDVEDAPPPMYKPGGQPHWEIASIVLLGAVLTMLVVIVLVRRGGPVQSTAAHDGAWAIRTFNQLASSRLEPKALFAELAATLRLFIQDRYGLPATRQTTAELIDALRNKGQLDDGDLLELRSILEKCDVVKFTQGVVDDVESNDRAAYIERATRIVPIITAHRPVNSAAPAQSE